jgi:hypothetical protein
MIDIKKHADGTVTINATSSDISYILLQAICELQSTVDKTEDYWETRLYYTKQIETLRCMRAYLMHGVSERSFDF